MKTTFGNLGNDGQLSNVMQTDLNKVQSRDPLAFSYGQFRGKTYKEESDKSKGAIKQCTNFRELAQEYLRGFIFGYKNVILPEGKRISKKEFIEHTKL